MIIDELLTQHYFAGENPSAAEYLGKIRGVKSSVSSDTSSKAG